MTQLQPEYLALMRTSTVGKAFCSRHTTHGAVPSPILQRLDANSMNAVPNTGIAKVASHLTWPLDALASFHLTYHKLLAQAAHLYSSPTHCLAT